MPSATSCAGGLVRAQELGGQATGVVQPQRSDGDLAHLRLLGPSRVQVREEGAGRRVFGAVRRHQQDRRRGGRAHQLHEQSGAVGVAPLDIVDEEDHPLPRAQRRHELTQSAERHLPHDERVAGDGPRERVDPRRAAEHGEEVRERPDPGRQWQLGSLHQVPGERVDEAVDRLVGHRLALVGAPAKDEDLPRSPRGRT